MKEPLLGPERAEIARLKKEAQGIKQSQDTIELCEMFGPVVQGEGVTAGFPSIFIRVSGCNFVCGLHNGEGVGYAGPDGDPITWWCDTETIWKQGRPYAFDEIIKWLKDIHEWHRVMSGNTHIIFTGGEPTMVKPAYEFMRLIDYMRARFAEEDYPNKGSLDRRSFIKYYMRDPGLADLHQYPRAPVVEIETNGSIHGEHVNALYQTYVTQINCSPKLSNSGMPRSMRVNTKALDAIMAHPNHWWKIVVSHPDDWYGFMQDYAHVFNQGSSETSRIIVMPAGSTQEELRETSQVAWDMAVRHNARYTDRYQVRVWNMATGK